MSGAAAAVSLEGLTGAGALVLVVGPSGAGKDSVLRGARAALIEEPRIRFPPRVVTRAADETEDNATMTEAEFAAADAAGAFLLVWRAHGLRYGIPAALGDYLRSGDLVVVNASRTVVTAARGAFARTHAVLVTAPLEIRAHRLRERGRDPDFEARLARDVGHERDLQPDLVIDNSGSLAASVESLCGFLLSAR